MAVSVRSPSRLSKWRDRYRFLAITWLSTTILCLLFTLGCYGFYWVVGVVREDHRVYSKLLRAEALTSMPAAEARRFFTAFDRMDERAPFVHQPWLGVSEQPFASPRLNIDAGAPVPRRRTVPPPAPAHPKAAKVVWLFGGSTMFGWGVPDDQTIPSHLAAVLAERLPDIAVTVVNQGHCYYYSFQESLLFELLLRDGQRCDAAVFLDGLNEPSVRFVEGKEVPIWQRDHLARAFDLEVEMNRPTLRARPFRIAPNFPPVRLARALKSQMLPPPPADKPLLSPEFRARVARHYKFNLEVTAATARLQGIQPLFVWQPTPDDAGRAALHAEVRGQVQRADFHDLADLFPNAPTDPSLYVDETHYGDRGCRKVAEAIADILLREP